MNSLPIHSGCPVSPLLSCITLLFVFMTLKLVLSSWPHCTSQMPSSFHLLLFSHSASLAFLLFIPLGSSVQPQSSNYISRYYCISRCLDYQLGKQIIFHSFKFFFLVGTAKWLVFKSKPKVKIKEMSFLSWVTKMCNISQHVLVCHAVLSKLLCCWSPLLPLTVYSLIFLWTVFPLTAFPLQLKMVLLAGIYWFQCEFW